jgi:hypothetical protein
LSSRFRHLEDRITPEELEWKTRKERVDRKLNSLQPPWSIVKYHPGMDTASLHCHAVEEYPTHSGPADYALFVKGKFLGIIEAKKVGVGPAGVLEQAKRYSRGASDGPGRPPRPRRRTRLGAVEADSGGTQKPEGRGPARPKEHKAEGEKLINAADSYRPGNFSPKNPPGPLFQRGRNEATIPIFQSYFSHVPLPETGVEKNLQQRDLE